MQPDVNLSGDALKDVCRRYERLCTGAMADIPDRSGYRNQVLPFQITPLTKACSVAGPAFTGQGYPAIDRASDDTSTRLSMLDSITPGVVSAWACGGSAECAHWGEIMSTAARQRGCTGTVIDSGVRDVAFIDAMGYPVFARFKCAASSIGRWKIREFQIPIRIGETVVRPGDFVFGDVDGVVIVPRELTLDVLAKAEDVFEREKGMREELRRGVPVKAAYEKHGSL